MRAFISRTGTGICKPPATSDAGCHPLSRLVTDRPGENEATGADESITFIITDDIDRLRGHKPRVSLL